MERERTFKLRIGLSIGILVLLSLVFFSSGEYFQRNLITLGINVILAVSLNLINGFTGQFSLGHAGFMAVGAYTSAMITTVMTQGEDYTLGSARTASALGLCLGLVGTGFLAMILGRTERVELPLAARRANGVIPFLAWIYAIHSLPGQTSVTPVEPSLWAFLVALSLTFLSMWLTAGPSQALKSLGMIAVMMGVVIPISDLVVSVLGGTPAAVTAPATPPPAGPGILNPNPAPTVPAAPPTSPIKGQLLFAYSLLVSGLMGAACGYLVGLPSLRLRGDYLAIVTLGFGEIIRVVVQNIEAIGGSRGIPGIPNYTNFMWVYLWVGLTVVAVYRITRSSHGRALMAVREDEIASLAMGVDNTQYKVSAFVISSFFAAVAGALFVHYLTVSHPSSFSFVRSFDAIIMVVLGGMGSISGSIAAAGILTLLPELLRDFEKYRMIIYSLLLAVLMLTRPYGMFGSREIWEYLGPARGKKD